MSLTDEKVAQAVGILDELGIDAWLTFVRETTEAGDPVLPIILGQELTWQSALIITRRGDRIAVVGKYEDTAVRSTGAWPRVVPYVQSIRTPLIETLTEVDPASIAVNFSVNDVKADGLSHGMHMILLDYLAGTAYADRLTSAERVIGALRGRKTPSEIERLRAAIATTNEIFRRVDGHVRPGMVERDVSRFMHDEAETRGAGLAWDPPQCPIVSTGPDSMIGHGYPSETLTVTEGRVFHLDFGVHLDDYCSDVQRAWWVPSAHRPTPTDDARRAFALVREAIDAAFATLRPGAVLHEVDAAARGVITGAGYPEYQHATGHHVGRAAHDGGGVIGPLWERYGDAPRMQAEPGHVYTLELGIEGSEHGYIGQEEMVLVTDTGATWLTAPQTELMILGAGASSIC